jgi:hypothetical protein
LEKGILIALFLLFPLVAKANEATLRLYDLKVKLKPKVVESKVYWQGREKIIWEEEIKNWHFGLLPVDKIIPPLIIDKENFYPEEEDYQGRYFWGKNNMQLLVFNPLNIEIRSCLEFFADSFKKQRTLEIWVNGRMVEKIEVSAKEEFSHFKIEDIFLNPGINEIRFFCLEGTDKLKPEEWGREKETREVSIKFKELRFGSLEVIQAAEAKELADNIKCVPQDDFLDIIFSATEPVIFSRDIDIDLDLEEFPFLNLDAEFIRAVDVKLIAFLGVDYTGDEFIDDYLNLEEPDEHNLFELAKDKWQEVNEYKDKFKLKRIILLLLPENGEVKEHQIGILRFKTIDLYNDNTLILVGREFNKDRLRFEDINVKSEVIDQEGIINLICYFDAAPFKSEEHKSIEEKTLPDKKRELEEVRVFIPLKDVDWKDYPYFLFRYNLDDSQIQDIELAILIEDEGKEKIFNLTKNQYKKSEEEIEVNLKEINSEEFDIEDLILRLKRRDDIDCSLPEREGWYQFQLSELRLYERFPYPIKSKQVKQRFLSLIQAIDLRLLKVDENVFGLNDFEGWEDCEDLEREVLSRRIELAKGKHNYERLENPTFDVEWVILEPAHSSSLIAHREEPEITFKKINPTKYLVKVSRAKSPFWLVFSESFHKQWRLYKGERVKVKGEREETEGKSLFDEIVADYPELKVKEARHLSKFAPEDIRYLFQKPLDAEHHLVNGYANGWYIEPDRLGVGEDFTLVIYFWPQSLFYLGLGISGLTLFGCISYLVYGSLRRKKGQSLIWKDEK